MIGAPVDDPRVEVPSALDLLLPLAEPEHRDVLLTWLVAHGVLEDLGDGQYRRAR